MDDSDHSPAEGLEQLYSLFEWHPPPLQLAPVSMGGSRTKSSRPASFYDKHLAPRLICRELVHIPNLHKKVASIVDQKIDELRGSDGRIALPPITSDVLTSKELRDEHVEELEHRMKDEKAVVEFYAKTTGYYCVRVASTIALHPTRWKSVLNWSASTSQRSKAVCDGSLQVRSHQPYMDDLLDADRLRELMEVGTRYKDLATWEMKSLSVGNAGVMLEVMSMVAKGGRFPWITCSGSCVNDKRPRVHTVENPVHGVDAVETLDIFTTPCADSDTGDINPYDSQQTHVFENNDDILDRALRRGGSSLEQAQEFNRELEEDGRRANSKRATERMMERQSDVQRDASLTPQSARLVRFQEPENADESRRPSPSRRKIFRSEGDVPAHNLVTAQSLIQQAWAQGVRTNSTFIILHSGNYEFVCFRHRASQILYVSDILVVKHLSEPGYGKLQIGIYMATLDDAFRRLALDKAREAASGAPPDERDNDGDSMNEDGRDDPDGRKRPSKRLKTSHHTISVSDVDAFMIWSITQQLSSRYVLLLHLQYDVYDTVKPAIFYRGARVNLDNEALLSPPTTPATSFPIDARLLLFLTSDIGEDSSGVLHDGVLEVEYDEKNSSTVPVIVKLAFTDEQQENLVQEWSVHMHMLSESVTGIQTVLGVFHEEEDEGPSCLVSCCTGTSLAERTSSLSPNQRASFLANLCSIHKAGVLHGDVGLHSLFIKDSDDAIIANFGRARVVDTTEDELQAEYQSMCKLLDSIP